MDQITTHPARTPEDAAERDHGVGVCRDLKQKDETALPVRQKPEAFCDFAFIELENFPEAPPGICRRPECRNSFVQKHRRHAYCSAACRQADDAEFRTMGLRLAEAALAARRTKYLTSDPAAVALARKARTYQGRALSEWLNDRNERAAIADEARDG